MREYHKKMGAEIEVADLLTKGMLKTARNSQEDDRHGRSVIRRVLTTGQERRNKPESSAAKLYCLHLQEPECKRASPQMAKPHPFLRRIILHLGRITP